MRYAGVAILPSEVLPEQGFGGNVYGSDAAGERTLNRGAYLAPVSAEHDKSTLMDEVQANGGSYGSAHGGG